MLTGTPLTGAIGAEIEDVDLDAPIAEDQAATSREALARRGVPVFRGQRLDFDAQLRLAAAFGLVMRLPHIETLEGHPEVTRVHKPQAG